MSDNAKRYRAIKDKLTKLYPSQPRGNVAIHLHTLAGISGHERGAGGLHAGNHPPVLSVRPWNGGIFVAVRPPFLIVWSHPDSGGGDTHAHHHF